MMLIEVDKRGPEFSIPLTYSNSASARFYIPSNMHIIGTMNTADRSLALVDFALRRRFAFVPLEPCFNENFKRTLVLQGVQQSFLNRMIEKVDSINTLIREDSNLGNGFLVSHSYFSSLGQNCVEDFQLILDNEIIPLLKEYWFDDEPKVRRIISDLQSW
jgi:5-methylcytosine-specific restriction protein B